MSGEHYTLEFLATFPEDGPWVIAIGPPGDVTLVGPFASHELVIRWYARFGDGQPIDVCTLVDPVDYPGAGVGGEEPLPDPQPELPLDGVD